MSAPCTGVSAVVTSSDPNRAPANVDIVVILLVSMTKSLPLAAVGGRGDPIRRKRSLLSGLFRRNTIQRVPRAAQPKHGRNQIPDAPAFAKRPQHCHPVLPTVVRRK